MSRKHLLHLGLFLLTLFTTTASGALRVHEGKNPDAAWWSLVFPLADGLSHSVPLLLILVCHELGHYVAARRHGVEASLPYFIPLPPFLGLGTMGAVIAMRRSTEDRRKLIDIGAAGPLAGLVVALPLLAWGIAHSPIGPLHPGDQLEGNSILYAVVKRLVTGLWLPSSTHDVLLHPTAFAAWAGLLVTMINLLPIAQLDGGHIATAYFGNRYRAFARALHRALPLLAVCVFVWVLRTLAGEAHGRVARTDLLLLSLFAALPWLVWFGLVHLLRRASGGIDHPPVDEEPLDARRRILFWIVVTVFALIFMPVPFRATLAGAP